MNAPSFAEVDGFDVGTRATSGQAIAPAQKIKRRNFSGVVNNYYKKPEKPA